MQCCLFGFVFVGAFARLTWFSLGDVTKRTNAMSKAGEKRSLDGGDGDKLPFTDEQLAALEEPNKGELHTER